MKEPLPLSYLVLVLEPVTHQDLNTWELLRWFCRRGKENTASSLLKDRAIAESSSPPPRKAGISTVRAEGHILETDSYPNT